MPADQASRGVRGVVVAHLPHSQDHASEHERSSLLGFASRLAALLGYEAGGLYDPARRYEGHAYFVPSCTLTQPQAAALGITGAGDLFGGVVPHEFVGTKAISHPLVHPEARRVEGWSEAFGRQVRDVVLAGYTAFDPADALTAATRLLARGAVRLKAVRASGGHGQSVVRDVRAMQQVLDQMDPQEIALHGLVLEEDMRERKTFSIGQVQVGALTASYFGVQRRTVNNLGAQVFGGSDLTVARGGFEALFALRPSPQVRVAIEQAGRYHAAVQACFPGFFASRSNYDVLLGHDAGGRLRSAVLEQSWRVGGATGPEIAALEVFHADPGRRWVRASCVEIFGDSPEPPAHATVYFRQTDPTSGPLTKYTVLHANDDPR